MQWRIGPFRMDMDNACLWRDETRLVLRPKAFELLAYLVERAGDLVTKDELLTAIWPETVVSENVLTVSMSELRKTLGETAREPQFIATVHRRGYRFIAPVTPVESLPATALAPPEIEALETPQTPAAERRQLTVLFCDLVGSTRLSDQLDPEDLQVVLQAYHTVCAEAIERFDGYVAQYLGDGVLAYFGYPAAHEDAARRAVHAGLGVIEAMAALNARLERERGVRLAVRLGIHTGLVVVDWGREGARAERLAVGATPNLAAHLQGLAAPNTVVISAETRALIQGFFEVEILGEHDLKGVSQPTVVYRVLGDSGLQSRLEAAGTGGLTPLVGREQEIGLLMERWEQTRDGQGQVILLSGESGIGKSRLVQVFKDHVAVEPHTRWECLSSPYHQHTALYPLIDLMQRLLQWRPDVSSADKLQTLEEWLRSHRISLPATMPLLVPLFSLPLPESHYPPLYLSPQRQRQKTLEGLVSLLLAAAEQQPLLFILEDLHWTDPTTLEFISLLIEQAPTATLAVLLTYRPHFQPAWRHRSYQTEIAINRLSRRQVEQMATHVTDGKMLPEDLMRQLVDKTDGVPLYVEEMTKALLESGHLKEREGRYELTETLSSLAIPATLQDSLMARLDRLDAAKAVAQHGSVIGREFSYELLKAIAPINEITLQHELSRLVDAELLYQKGILPNATYVFKHALICDSAYASLLKSARQKHHQNIAQVLEEKFPETAENQPELLAYHYTEAGLNALAVTYWHRAGQRLIERLAPREAIVYLSKGLELLRSLPDNPTHLQQELSLLTALGPAMIATQGPAAAEVEAIYTRAHALCQQVDDRAHALPVLRGLCNFYQVRKDLRTARAFAEQLLDLGRHSSEAGHLIEAHGMLGVTLFFQGDFAQALAHFDQCLALDDAQPVLSSPSHDPNIGYFSYRARALWCLGYPDQALASSQEALRRAQQLSHPQPLAACQVFTALVSWLRRDPIAAQQHADAAVSVARELGFQFQVAFGLSLRGWALVMQGHVEAGMADIHEGLAALRAARASALHAMVYFIEACASIGRVAEGMSVLTEGLALVEQNDERLLEAELYRLKGELLLQQWPDNPSEAASCFRQAIVIAQNQSAKSWELRAAVSLAKLWQSQGKRQAAYDLLAPVYDWFAEGFDTPDLIDARMLLNELS